MGGRGTHDVLLVVGGSPVLGAPVADAKQQRPPASAHGGGGGGDGGEQTGERCRVRAGGGSGRGFWFRSVRGGLALWETG